MRAKEAMEKKRNREPTEFEQKVYDCVKRIPPGYVASYQTVAQEVGTCPRAIGGAMRGNPFAPVVPWHRVVAKDRQLGGFSGQWGKGEHIDRKLKLLRQEGVIITAQAQNEDDTNSLKIDKQCILSKIPATSSPQQVSISRSLSADKQNSALSRRKKDAEEQADQKPKRKRQRRK